MSGMTIKHLARRAAHRVGVDVRRHAPTAAAPADFDEATRATLEAVRPFTMTSPERVHALCHAIRYVTAAGIAGAVVECGVWRGGSMMAAARTLTEQGDTSRDLFLFDTFEGMPPPTVEDGAHVAELFTKHDRIGDGSDWCYATLDDVQANVASIGYPSERVHYVKGRVEDTIPGEAPDPIALLRLDTDFYQSTAHELAHLFGRIPSGGVLIIDDYGRWEGARRAVDEFLPTVRPMLLNRIDGTGRIGVVP